MLFRKREKNENNEKIEKNCSKKSKKFKKKFNGKDKIQKILTNSSSSSQCDFRSFQQDISSFRFLFFETIPNYNN